MKKFTPIEIEGQCNSSKSKSHITLENKPRFDAGTLEAIVQLSLSENKDQLIPFECPGPEASADYIVLPAPTSSDNTGQAITLPVEENANYICIAHCCTHRDEDMLQRSIGDELAKYTLVYADGSEYTKVIRRAFEINTIANPPGLRGAPTFVAKAIPQITQITEPSARPWGLNQTGTVKDLIARVWVYAMPNPHPQKEIKELRMAALTEDGIAIFGVTLAHFPEHPLRLNPRNTFLITLPDDMQIMPEVLSVSLDMGHVTMLYGEPGLDEETWLKDPLTGLGQQRRRLKEPKHSFMVEATGTGAASFEIRAQDKEILLSYGEAITKGESRSSEGARITLCYPGKTMVRVKVTDEETGTPIPTRIRFLGPRGEYLPPHGHPAVVNTNWFEDEGGNLVLGNETFAYVPGEFQIELPVEDVFVEITHGFEYEPKRKKLSIDAGVHELNIKMRRFVKMREQNFVTADTHVHFLSPQTAWLEGQCEGLNLVNLLASQWGKLYTNVSDITGEVSGCSKDDTVVFVSTENRHHILGHMNLLGIKGMPVFPMCTGGPGEAWFGDPDIRSQADWADECRAKGGVVIRPHFPFPNMEIAADIVLGKVDALEVRAFGVTNDTLDSLPIREWYRYLNCGYRVPAVGGTDKMSAAMPVGGVRTYAKLFPNTEFTFNNWGKAVRAGRTFTTSGPLIGLTVEGREVGEEIHLPAGGGTLEVESWAVCAQPINGLEIINNGRVIARSESREGTQRLELKEKIKVGGSGWLAARCFSYHQVWYVRPVNLAAHTSPIYIVVDNQQVFNPSDAVYLMTLIHGGMEWVDTLAIRADEHSHRRLRSVFESAESELNGKLKEHHHHH